MWHLPQLYDLAIRNDAVHTAEHTGFLVTAILFWATVLRLTPRERLGNGLRILYVFAQALQGSVLGAVITFAARPLYATHAEITNAWGFEQLVDQQIAGLIMWVPPAVLYLGVSAYLFVGWLDAVRVRQAALETREAALETRQAVRREGAA
jgi:putative membrane protein